MKRPSFINGALIGGLTSLPLMAILYLGDQLASLPFTPFSMFDWMARVLPGDLITLGIDLIVDIIIAINIGSTSEVAKTVEQLMALMMFLTMGVVVGAFIGWLSDRDDLFINQIGLIVGLAVAFFTLFIELNLGFDGNLILGILWVIVLFAGWGWFINNTLHNWAAAGQADGAEGELDYQPERRAMLLKLAGGSAGVAIGAWGVGRLLDSGSTTSGASQPLADAAPTAAPGATTQATAMPDMTATATMRDRIAAAPGTRPELTPNEDFYRIDINTRPPVIEEEEWAMQAEGLFDNPRPLTLKDLMEFPTVTQAVTMGCISNRIGGDLISTSNWTGARLRDVLADLGIRDEAKELYIEAEDGFFESVAMEDIMDPRTLLVYGMNGETLPVEHGFPLRIYIPNRYGMKQPKWITRIEAIDEEGPGYWVTRGWSAEARPRIVSVVDAATNVDENGRVNIGGIAWAGDRGIQKVEVQINDSEWQEATLRTPPLSSLTWVQWRYDWLPEDGTHDIRVRATDGTGMLQIEEEQGVRPDGATGYHSKRIRI